MKRIQCLLGILLFSLYAGNSFAQVKIVPRWEVGLSVGKCIYQGDVTPYNWGDFEEGQTCFNVLVRHYIYPTIAWRAQIFNGTLKGDESKYGNTYRQHRAFKFKTSVTELSFLMEWELFGDEFGKRFSDAHQRGFRWRNMYFSPYIFGGPALSFFSPALDVTNTQFDYFGGEFTAETVEEDKKASKMSLMIPAGFGFKFDFGSIALFTEATARLSFTDNLDGVSKTTRGDGKDSYYSYNIGITYRLKPKDMWVKMYGERNKWVKEKYIER